MGLSEKKRALLADFVDNLCEQCHKHEKEIGKLHPHRLKRGWEGGTYEHRNLKMVCTSCHKQYHANEFPRVRNK